MRSAWRRRCTLALPRTRRLRTRPRRARRYRALTQRHRRAFVRHPRRCRRHRRQCHRRRRCRHLRVCHYRPQRRALSAMLSAMLSATSASWRRPRRRRWPAVASRRPMWVRCNQWQSVQSVQSVAISAMWVRCCPLRRRCCRLRQRPPNWLERRCSSLLRLSRKRPQRRRVRIASQPPSPP